MRRAAAERLFLTDGEISERVLGPGCADQWLGMAAVLEREGLPRPDRLFDNRRYWPAVRAFLDRRAGLSPTLVPDEVGFPPDGKENWG